MAIYVTTDSPRTLVRRLKALIDEGDVLTWRYDSDGDFTHSALQWNNKAWIRPFFKEDKVIFGIVNPQHKTIDRALYSIYMGRFTELLIAHSYKLITERIQVSAKPSIVYDHIADRSDEE